MLTEIQFGSISISTYWLMLLIGAIGMLICTWHRRERFHLTILQSITFTVLLTIVGFTGAKLLYILENIPNVLAKGFTLGGVSFFGSVFLIPLIMPLFGRLFNLQGHETMDVCGPCVAIMIGCMRFGCFLQGCCGGWEACIGNMSFQWPTQAIESIGDFAILAFLLKQEERNKHNGVLYPMFMLLYSAMRFLIEFLRDTPKDWLLLSHGQWFSITAILIGLVWIHAAKRKDSGI